MGDIYDIDDIKRKNARGGRYFFAPATNRFFDSRTLSKVYQGPGGVYFVTSERFHGSTGTGPRLYTVRAFDPETGGISTLHEYNRMTKREAQAAAAAAAARTAAA